MSTATKIACGGLVALCVLACTQPPPVNDSRDALWRQFAHQPVDNLLMAWGTPAGETRLTNGSRMIMYRHATIYDASPAASCEVSFLAPPSHYRIENIAMTGDAFECYLLAQGQRGNRYINDLPPPGPFIYPYHPYPYR